MKYLVKTREVAAAKALACYVGDQDAEPGLTQTGRKAEFHCVTFRQRTPLT